MIKFSVIIPCFNCAKTLPDTLKSCIDQTYKCFEIIVIDDCSTESINTIIDSYIRIMTDNSIIFLYYRVDKNNGVSFARNKGWDIAKGDYVCFLDSDDIWHKDKLKIAAQHIQKERHKVVCHNYTELYDFGINSDSSCHLVQIKLLEILAKNPAQTSCFIISKNIEERFNHSMRYSEDYELWLRLFKKYPIYKITGKPLTRLLRPACTTGGLSGETFKMRIGEIKAYYNFLDGIEMLFFPILLCYSIIKYVRFKITQVNRRK